MNRCRQCRTGGTLRRVSPRGALEEKAARLLRLVPVHCVNCGARYSLFAGSGGRRIAAISSAEPRSSKFTLPPTPDREDFDALQAQLREAESRLEIDEPLTGAALEDGDGGDVAAGDDE